MTKKPLLSLATFILVLTLSLEAIGAGTSHLLQAEGRTFPETGKTVKGRFLQYWTASGGLPQQGYPISEEIQERSDTDGKMYTVQYFERAVFELHPQNQPPYDVLLQLLGVFRYTELYYRPDGDSIQKPNTEPGAKKFPQTGKTVGGKFLEYWNKNGGLPQFGYPIADEFQERSPLNGNSYTVQYFERAIFELHPENQPPYDVLLSQLGAFRWQMKDKSLIPTSSPTVTSGPTATPGSMVTPEFRSDIPDGQYIQLYPGAIIKSVYDKSYAYRNVWYEAPVDEAKVRAFYDDVMPKYGWVLVYSLAPYSKRYSWTDPLGILPWHLSLSVVTSSVGGRPPEVRFIYKRYPDINKIPMHPDAQDIVVSAGQSGPPLPASCSDTVTNTTYIINATPTEVESFYKSALPPQGWEPSNPIKSIESVEGMQFQSDHEIRYRHSGQYATWTIKRLDLSITAQEEAGGLARITIVLKTCEFDQS